MAGCVLGRVPVNSAATGPVQLLLRLEQIVLSPSTTLMAQVVAVSFAGATCTVTLQLADHRLILRRSFADPPVVGQNVAVSVVGLGQLVE